MLVFCNFKWWQQQHSVFENLFFIFQTTLCFSGLCYKYLQYIGIYQHWPIPKNIQTIYLCKYIGIYIHTRVYTHTGIKCIQDNPGIIKSDMDLEYNAYYIWKPEAQYAMIKQKYKNTLTSWGAIPFKQYHIASCIAFLFTNIKPFLLNLQTNLRSL